MAETAGVRQMLERIGFTNEAATEIVGDQGINSIDELRTLDDKMAENLCKVLRRPGGATAGGNADPGLKVSARAEFNLKLAIYFIKHQDRVSRVVRPGDIDLAGIRRLVKQRDTEEGHTDPDIPPKISIKDWPATMEAVEEYLRQFRGQNGVPLNYVVRKDLKPIRAADDPAINYDTLDEEMIARAPILESTAAGALAELELNGPFVDSYITDRTLAWDKLAPLFQTHESWTYFKSARKTRNGRMAFKAVFNHYLGPNNVDHMATKAERKLRDTIYRAETRQFNFEKYVTLHKTQHQVLLSLEDYGYRGIDERSKVRYLIDGIKTTKLDTIKAAIIGSAEYRSDFDACVTLYKDFLKQVDMQPELKIAAIETDPEKGNDKKGGGGKGFKGPITDRYYRKQEYNKFSTAQKNELRELRGGRKRGADGESKAQIAALESQNKALEAQIAAIEAKTEELLNQADGESGGNRNHAALTRQKKAKK